MILLDTHIWLWWLHDPERLSSTSIACIDAEELLLVSVISVWEISLKLSVGKLELPLPISDWFAKARMHPRVIIEPLDPWDAIASTQLPGEFHKDPADRILVAIARRYDIPLVTCDQKILSYPYVKTIA